MAAQQAEDPYNACPDRHGTFCIKWDRWAGVEPANKAAGGVIPMWVADMDLLSPEPVVRAIEQRASHGVFGYTFEASQLSQCAAEWLHRRHGWDVRPEWLVWIPGIVCGINIFVRSLSKPGEKVTHLCHTPAYPPFLAAPGNHEGHSLVKLPLRLDDKTNRWHMDIDAIDKAAVEHGAKSFILCHPHNPTGRDWTLEELNALADVCERRDLVVLSDEIWADLVVEPGRRHVPFAKACPRMAKRTITCLAPSKTFNIAGLGCSVAVIEDETLRANYARAACGIVPHVNLLGLSATKAAWGGECDAWVDGLQEHLRANRDAIARALAEVPAVRWSLPEATYLFWIDVRAALPDGVTPEGVAQWLVEQHGVGLSDGVEFDAPGWLRINYGCPAPRLAEALRRIVRAFSKGPASHNSN
eukprot:m51a1_g2131 putative aspartate aminotransferase (414) ;mRNA; r:1704499-1706190